MKTIKKHSSEWLLAAAILISLVLLINPFDIIMTDAYIMTSLMLLGLAVIAFGVFVWRETFRDEREQLHGLQAGRLSYLAGGGTIVVAIIVQTLTHTLDIWLVIALAVMVTTKLAVRAWNYHR